MSWLRRMVDELRRAHAAALPGPVDARVPAALVTCALAVTLIQYGARAEDFVRWFPAWAQSPWGASPSWIFRTAIRVVCYVLLPLLVARATGTSLRELGLGLPDFRAHRRIYLIAVAVIMPFVVAASGMRGFQRTYPLCSDAAQSYVALFSWWLVYAIYYFAIEFFYRGFLVGMLRRSLGAYGVIVMMVPYVMIHFPKPMTETLSAILAALFLGALALATRSMWYGLAIHVTVGYAMDALSLLRQGILRDMPLR